MAPIILAAGIPAYLSWKKKKAAAGEKTVPGTGPNELE
jgi:hypothetical protein